MNTQLELFPIEEDRRIANLTSAIRFQLVMSPMWFPTVREILYLSDTYKVNGRKPLELYEQIKEEKFRGREEHSFE